MKRISSNSKMLLVISTLLLLGIGGVRARLIFRPEALESFPLLMNATVDNLSAGLSSKKFTSVDLVTAYLARISEVNEELHAVVEVNPDALKIAAELDSERRAGVIRSPLHGIPLLIKNNIATNDKMNNTGGSFALLGAKVPRDSTVVRKLRSAGAIILGKTNLSQWANWRSLNSSNGWSALGGQVYGPYYPEQDPQGSSSGSGVGAALGLALGCLGTETDGSITSPSSVNNVVGIKPTVGLTSRNFVIPVSEHQDTIGPLAGTVKDAAYILQAIAGVDPHDNYTYAIPVDVLPNYVAACDLSALSGARLGIPRNVFTLFQEWDTNGATVPIVKEFERSLGILRSAGAILIEDTNFTAAAEFWNSSLPNTIINADFVVNIQSYLQSLEKNPKDLSSLIELQNFTQSFPLERYPARDTGLWDEALQNWNNTSPLFWPAYQKNIYYGNEGGLLGALDRHNLDAVILPARFAPFWTSTIGSPIVTVPLGSYPANAPIVKTTWGLVDSAPNVPFGISFLGAKFSEAKLIGLAYSFEQRTMARNRIVPYIMPSTELEDVVGI